jgi:sortase A
VTHDTSKADRRAQDHDTATTSQPDRAGTSVAPHDPTDSTSPDAAPPASPADVAGAPPAPGSTGTSQSPADLGSADQKPTAAHPALPVGAVATISVAAIQLDAPVREGVSPSVLDLGPGHWPGSAAPGGFGNLVIAGHRTTSTHPFGRIGELAPGDPIVVSDATGSYTYVVEGSDVVRSDHLDVARQTSGHTLTLIAAHPPGSEQYRYVVRARLVSAPRPAGA